MSFRLVLGGSALDDKDRLVDLDDLDEQDAFFYHVSEAEWPRHRAFLEMLDMGSEVIVGWLDDTTLQASDCFKSEWSSVLGALPNGLESHPVVSDLGSPTIVQNLQGTKLFQYGVSRSKNEEAESFWWTLYEKNPLGEWSNVQPQDWRE